MNAIRSLFHSFIFTPVFTLYISFIEWFLVFILLLIIYKSLLNNHKILGPIGRLSNRGRSDRKNWKSIRSRRIERKHWEHSGIAGQITVKSKA